MKRNKTGRYLFRAGLIRSVHAAVVLGFFAISVNAQTALPPLPELPVDELALYSSYPSESLTQRCGIHRHCREDLLPPEAFSAALKNSVNASKILMGDSQATDYELLIANLGRTDASTSPASAASAGTEQVQFAEFTLSWRGVELSSTIVEQQFPATESDATMASRLIDTWWQAVGNNDIFSPGFLYQQLNASNYAAELKLPGTIDTFSKALTELYHDPLEGVISRYTHPDYTEALLDISVYPIRQSLSTNTSAILDDELKHDLAQAEAVAKSRALTLSLIHTPEDTEVSTTEGVGRRLALQASSPTRDTIYASIYAFRLRDKIIKITTTMPPAFSDVLVSRAVPLIRVPGESRLMAMLRAKSRPDKAAGGK